MMYLATQRGIDLGATSGLIYLLLAVAWIAGHSAVEQHVGCRYLTRVVLFELGAVAATAFSPNNDKRVLRRKRKRLNSGLFRCIAMKGIYTDQGCSCPEPSPQNPSGCAVMRCCDCETAKTNHSTGAKSQR